MKPFVKKKGKEEERKIYKKKRKSFVVINHLEEGQWLGMLFLFFISYR